MKQQITPYTNGKLNGLQHHTPSSDEKQIKETVKRVLEELQVTSSVPKKKRLKVIEAVSKFHEKNKETLNNIQIDLLFKQKTKLKNTVRFLKEELAKEQKENVTREKCIKRQEKEKVELQHEITKREKTVKRIFSSSNILQLVEPKLLTSKNLFDRWKYRRKYKKEKKEYNRNVLEMGKIPSVAVLGEQNGTYQLDKNPLRKTLIKSLVVYDRYLEFEDTEEKYGRIYYLDSLPAFISPNALYNTLAFPIPLQFSMIIKPTPKTHVQKMVKNTIINLKAKQYLRRRNQMEDDLEVTKNIQEQETFANELIYEVEQGLEYSLVCMLKAKTKEELDELHKIFINHVEGNEMLFNTYSYGQKQALKEFMPFSDDHIKESKLLKSSVVSYLTPFSIKSWYEPEGIYLGRTIYHKSQVFIDPFRIKEGVDTNNSNINIFGQSGAGKSTTAKVMATRFHIRGIQNIFIDPEGEYINLAKHLHGDIVEFSRENGINPFIVYKKAKNVEDAYSDHIQKLKTFFKFFINPKVYDGATLDKSLMNLYRNSEETPQLKDLLHVLKDDPMVKELEVLETGSLKGVFNAKKKLEITNDNVVFSLKSLGVGEKRDAAMYLLTSLITDIIQNDISKKRMLFIDEAYKLFREEDTGRFFFDIVKTARKWNLGVVSITQDVSDFTKYSWGEAVITNSETKILLKQSLMNLPYMNAIAPMTEPQKLEITRFTKGEALLFRGEEYIRVKIDVLPFEAEYSFTTPKKEAHGN